MKNWNEYVGESKFEVYHKSYTSAVDSALSYANNRGFELDDDEVAQSVGLNSSKPGRGKTTKVSLSLIKNGKEVKQKLHFQVYNRDIDPKPYELNVYIS